MTSYEFDIRLANPFPDTGGGKLRLEVAADIGEANWMLGAGTTSANLVMLSDSRTESLTSDPVKIDGQGDVVDKQVFIFHLNNNQFKGVTKFHFRPSNTMNWFQWPTGSVQTIKLYNE